jgi:8-oxo-dGTP pyrophosphatase MutT (NUDIX family)
VVANVLPAEASNPLNFDGVLPRWHGPGFRIEVDRVTGRQKLHLCIAESTYFAFRATQVPEAADLAGDAALCSRILTINLLVMDDHDVVLLVRRSAYVVNAGRFTGTVSGNCELVSREGLSADLDGKGLPDLMAAIIRETREELGMDLNAEESRLGALGVFEVNGAMELGTYILVATARIPGHARDFRVKRSGPDPVEGLWEIGNVFMTIDLAAILRKRATGYRFTRWLRACDELTPNAVGSLLLLIIARLELRQHQAVRTARNGMTAGPLPWTTSDLAKWLEEPIHVNSRKPRNVVSLYTLWE